MISSPDLMIPVVPRECVGKTLSGSWGLAVFDAGHEAMKPAARV